MSLSIPTLSVDGWITALDKKADTILANFIVTNESQTNLHKSSITSLPAIIAKCSERQMELKDQVTAALEQLFGTYFERADIQVDINVDPDGTGNTSVLGIRMDVRVTSGDQVYSLGRLIRTANSRILSIIDVRNINTA